MKILINKLKTSRLDKIQPFLDLGILQNGVVLAGGALRTLLVNDEIKDFDIFFSDANKIAATREKLLEAGFELIFSCPLDLLFTYRKGNMIVQLITEREYKDCQELIDSFDINACRFATDGEFLYTSREAIIDVLKNRISLFKINYPLATFRRIVKYHKKGFKLFTAPRQFIEMVRLIQDAEMDMRGYID